MTDIATLTPPKGWKILSHAEQQAFIREHLGDASDIIAIALPSGGDGSVFAQLSYRPVGYVDDNTPIDPTRVRQGISEDLDILNQESGLTGKDAVRWKTFAPAPKYDPASRCVEYGVELSVSGDPALNLYKMCLVRNGAIVLTLVGTPTDGLDLNNWVITPQNNLRYERFDPKSDRRAEGNLINLLLMNRFI
ncbi:DUF2167 domain-containing protein [Cardiobacterium sp. Marseille-Q4385]|jgi:hypothetical protein|uniref:DUF2167 domain-containing protein n=1 Tax=Cardiobacterium sp. Marseille-Q4385 TaxID=2866573 RepID=UPI001CE3BED4|nr:DUF2167 domain-containing protein [Cardiobacterium sp. Marseille-Q4385]